MCAPFRLAMDNRQIRILPRLQTRVHGAQRTVWRINSDDIVARRRHRGIFHGVCGAEFVEDLRGRFIHVRLDAPSWVGLFVVGKER